MCFISANKKNIASLCNLWLLVVEIILQQKNTSHAVQLCKEMLKDRAPTKLQKTNPVRMSEGSENTMFYFWLTCNTTLMERA